MSFMGLAKLSTATNFKLSGVEHFVGTANADYIVVNNLGMTITGGLGADEIILDSGHDTVVFTDAETDASDIVKQFESARVSRRLFGLSCCGHC
jgi:Ca2+-binding RTX toxin-like protein